MATVSTTTTNNSDELKIPDPIDAAEDCDGLFADGPPRVAIRYKGPRPFRIAPEDKMLVKGDVIDVDHPYWRHRDTLLACADFEEV